VYQIIMYKPYEIFYQLCIYSIILTPTCIAKMLSTSYWWGRKNHKLHKISSSSKSFVQNPVWEHGKCTYFSPLTYQGQVVILRKNTNSYFWIKGQARGTCVFSEHNFELKDRFLDQIWLLKIAYLIDIFTKINELNFTLQGIQVNCFTAHEKIHAFR